MGTVEETALAIRSEQSYELAPTAAAAAQQYEIQSAMIIARRYPRNEDRAFEKLMKASIRPSFAAKASYSFPRGKKKDSSGKWVQNYVEGPSVNLAREGARAWGHLRYGVDVIRDDDDTRQIRGWAWDLETNVKVTQDDDFKKAIMKKRYINGKEDGVDWVHADERELRELTNRRGAILERNCIIKLLPPDLIEDARTVCDRTAKSGVAADPEGEKKKVILAFSELNVNVEMLEGLIGHKLDMCSPIEIADLRKIYKSIADGTVTWSEYMESRNKDDDPDPKDEIPPIEPTKKKQKTDSSSDRKEESGYTDKEPDPFAPGGDMFGK